MYQLILTKLNQIWLEQRLKYILMIKRLVKLLLILS